jgi:hypothetical protein
MTIRHVALIIGVLCLPQAALAQSDAERMAEVICAGDVECLTLAKYELTAEGLRKMFAASRELFPLLKENPELYTRMRELSQSTDPGQKLGTVTGSGQVYDRIPEIAQVLGKYQISGREYAFTHAVAMLTAMAEDTFARAAQRGSGSGIPSEYMTPAMKFWRSMDPALRAEADAWKKMWGYDQGLNR